MSVARIGICQTSSVLVVCQPFFARIALMQTKAHLPSYWPFVGPRLVKQRSLQPDAATSPCASASFDEKINSSRKLTWMKDGVACEITWRRNQGDAERWAIHTSAKSVGTLIHLADIVALFPSPHLLSFFSLHPSSLIFAFQSLIDRAVARYFLFRSHPFSSPHTLQSSFH